MAAKIPLKGNVTIIYNLLNKARDLASRHDEKYKTTLDEVSRISSSLNYPVGIEVFDEIHGIYNKPRTGNTT